ncbi:MAG: tetratricopeptide repeat protein [Deltaproteobacteria bacterium]|nr:tetratricopeptide repeat protein [Deltaproteobacteria bacterium]
MDGSNTLKKIEKEIIEARALIIKSNNLTNSLSAEVRSIAKRQSSYERNISANSFVVYIIIAVLAFAGAQIVYNIRHQSLQKDIATIEAEAKKDKQELEQLKKESGGTAKKSDKDLEELYNLINNGERIKAIEQIESINPATLTYLENKLLTDIDSRFRDDLSIEHYLKAMEFEAASKYPEAVEEFKQSLSYKDNSGHAKAAKIQMADALRLQGKPREAIALLQKVIEDHLDRELSDDAMWYLAKSHQDAHQKDEALSVLKALMRRFPDSQYYRDARVKAAELKLHMWRDDMEK